jgi:hypothetical protein
MTTMTAEQRMKIASARLDAWLESFDKLDDPIETALNDVSAYADELSQLVEGSCWNHARTDCLPCMKTAVSALGDSDRRLRDLWEARES